MKVGGHHKFLELHEYGILLVRFDGFKPRDLEGKRLDLVFP